MNHASDTSSISENYTEQFSSALDNACLVMMALFVYILYEK